MTDSSPALPPRCRVIVGDVTLSYCGEPLPCPLHPLPDPTPATTGERQP